MPAVSTGTAAPDFSLPGLHGENFSLRDALERGPVVAAFFKISCPVCQLTLPYLERIYRAYPQGKYTLVGISQDEENFTEEFAREFGVTFPLLLDDAEQYLVSNAYELTNVPTIFLIATDGAIQMRIEGWDKRDMQKLNAVIARASGGVENPLFQRGEDVPASKPG
jgi:peroxiredoxin